MRNQTKFLIILCTLLSNLSFSASNKDLAVQGEGEEKEALANLEKLILTGKDFSEADLSNIFLMSSLRVLVLQKNKIGGNLPVQIALLQNLKTLSFRENHLTGNIPEELFLLVHLEFLDLRSNELSGSLSKSFRNLQRLKELFLGDNEFEGEIPEEFAEIGSLGTLCLQRNKLTGKLPEALRQRLRVFKIFPYDLSGNDLEVPQGFLLKDDY